MASIEVRDNQPLPLIAAVDLFCGVGGLTHGLELAGVAVRAGFDVDPACEYPYASNNSSDFVLKDVAELTGSDLKPYLTKARYSLLAGCAPCQPFSRMSQPSRKAGNLGGAWQLVEDFGRLLSELSPDFVTMENVAELAQHPVFATFLRRMTGYFVSYEVMDLAQLGVPQSRRRLVLIASKHGQLALPTSASARRPRTVRQAIGSLPPIAAGESHPKDPLHTSSRLSRTNLERIRNSRPGGTWRDWDEALRASCHRADSGATYPSVYGRMEWDRAAPTMTTQFYGYGTGRFGHPDQDRALSLREGAMLQTFPRGYRFVRRGEPVHFKPLGRLIGNAVPVRLGAAVGKRLMSHAAGLSEAD